MENERLKICTGGNHSKNSSTVAPSRKFSNNAATGTLVPRNTHAPRTLSGYLSIASKVSHPFIAYSSSVNGKVTLGLIINWQLSDMALIFQYFKQQARE